MAADASIYAQFRRPVRSMAEYAADYDVAEGNALKLAAARLDAQKAQRAMADEDAIRGLARQHGGDENALIRAFRAGGYFDKAEGLQKSIDERLKAKSDLAKTDAETEAKRFEVAKGRYTGYRMALGALLADPNLTRDKATSVANGLVDAGYITPEFAQRATSNLPEDVSALRAHIQAGLDMQLTPEQLSKAFAPDWKMESTGARKVPVQSNPRAAGFNANQPLQMEQTPDSVASNARMVEEGRLNRGVTMRGQNLADARAREATAATLSKPFEVTGQDGTPMLVQQDKQGNIRPVQGYGPKAGAEKPLNDTQSKALLFGSRMREADKVLESLAKAGTTTSIPGARTGYGVGAALNVLSSSQQQQLNQAKRDFVNAVLRRESGAVISDPEFANAEQQYFPQVGDKPATIAQKARNRRLAIDGILAEVPANRRDSLKPQESLPSADDVRKQADAILRGG